MPPIDNRLDRVYPFKVLKMIFNFYINEGELGAPRRPA
jgi:hypothetical protein